MKNYRTKYVYRVPEILLPGYLNQIMQLRTGNGTWYSYLVMEILYFYINLSDIDDGIHEDLIMVY